MSKPVKIQPKGFTDWKDKFRAWGRQGGRKAAATMSPEKKAWCKTQLSKLGVAARKKKKAKLVSKHVPA